MIQTFELIKALLNEMGIKRAVSNVSEDLYQKSFKSETTQNKVQRNVSICHINGTFTSSHLIPEFKNGKGYTVLSSICLKFQ